MSTVENPESVTINYYDKPDVGVNRVLAERAARRAEAFAATVETLGGTVTFEDVFETSEDGLFLQFKVPATSLTTLFALIDEVDVEQANQGVAIARIGGGLYDLGTIATLSGVMTGVTTTVQVSSLAVALKAGDKIKVINNLAYSDPVTYPLGPIPQTLTVSADVAKDATSIPVTQATISQTYPAGSTVVLAYDSLAGTVRSLQTLRTQDASRIEEVAQSTGVSRKQLATVTSDYASGATVSDIDISDNSRLLKKGEVVAIEAEGGQYVTVTLDADSDPAGTAISLSIESLALPLNIASGAGIYMTFDALSTRTTQTAEELLSIASRTETIESDFDEFGRIGLLESSVSTKAEGTSITTINQRIDGVDNDLTNLYGGYTPLKVAQLSAIANGPSVTTLQVSPLSADLYVGESLVLQDKDTFQIYNLVVDADAAKDATSITVQSANLVNVPVGSFVNLGIAVLKGQINVNAGQITTILERTQDLENEFGPGGTIETLESSIDSKADGTTVSTLQTDVTNLSSDLSRQMGGVVQNAVATLTSPVDGGSITTLPVTALKAALTAGDTIVVQDLDTYQATTITVGVDAAKDSTSITINSASLTLATGSPVMIPNRIFEGRLSVLSDEIDATVTKTENAALAAAETKIRTDISGSITSLPVEAIPYALKNGEKVLVYTVANKYGAPYTFTLTGDAPINSTTLPVTCPETPSLKVGDPVYFADTVLAGRLTITDNNVTLATTRATNAAVSAAHGTVTSAASGTVSTIAVTALPLKLNVDDTIKVFSVANNLSTFTSFTVSANAAKGATSISVTPKAATLASGDPVVVDSGVLEGRISVNATNITNRISKGGEVITELNINMNGIDVDAKVFKSSDYVKGVSGWAIHSSTHATDPGLAEFDNLVARGNFYAGNFKLTAAGVQGQVEMGSGDLVGLKEEVVTANADSEAHYTLSRVVEGGGGGAPQDPTVPVYYKFSDITILLDVNKVPTTDPGVPGSFWRTDMGGGIWRLNMSV
jgi:hypothetical protein